MNKSPIVIVIGNEKGGAGKTTTAMNIIISLLYLDFKVVSIDTDVRQLSLTRYIENRVNTIDKIKSGIPLPTHYKIVETKTKLEEKNQLDKIISKSSDVDFIIIDTPGTSNEISRYSHSKADIIITPINDSFVDIDLLANIDPENFKILKPGIYSQMVWEEKINRAKQNNKSIDWIVVRNRVSHIDTRNKRNIEKVISSLSKRIGCRLASGFGERVIFKELFLKGLTLLDIKNKTLKTSVNMSMSHIIARQELFSLLTSLNIEDINQNIKSTIL
ncbi:MAG: division plane positioning ATPase MipZ [Alphaproteobacteria bacterium]|nr:division plane positioning ATPase MipZ [Alphaproteobacteria bacterium]